MIKEILKLKTQSLCPHCYNQVEAMVYSNDARVFMKKFCPQHGESTALVEDDVACYKTVAHLTPRESGYFHSLVLPVTYRCNLDCEFCYLPQRFVPDMPIEEVRKQVRDFKGSFIALSGGEPTLRKDLCEVIEYINAQGKIAVLLTNGIALEDFSYVQALKQAGLGRIFFSFDGFRERVYRCIKNSGEILAMKRRALENIKRLHIPTMLSMTVYRGINDDEIADVFSFACLNSDFVHEFRIRSAAHIGKFQGNIAPYTMSEMIRLFEKAASLKEGSALRYHLCRYAYYTPYSVDLKLNFIRMNGKIKLVGFIPAVTNTVVGIVFKSMSVLHLDRFFKNRVYRLAMPRPFLKQIIVHFACWPTVDTIDFGELKSGIAHLFDGEIVNFCHAIILNEIKNK
ncbi:MAG TPA: radical SAM protein [Candidatus Omnitrophota bacterium]|nr:radical SAM protein [Candidatus Omnitrophota bacterium]